MDGRMDRWMDGWRLNPIYMYIPHTYICLQVVYILCNGTFYSIKVFC